MLWSSSSTSAVRARIGSVGWKRAHPSAITRPHRLRRFIVGDLERQGYYAEVDMGLQRSRRGGLGGAHPSIVAALVLAGACSSCAETPTPVHVGWGPAEIEAEQRC